MDVKGESGEDKERLIRELHDGTKTFANLFPPFCDSHNLVSSISW